MSQTLTVNGVAYSYPSPGDTNWGANASDWASAVTSGMLQKAGGAFTLLAEADFGATYGLKAAYFKSRTASSAAAGALRLARTDTLSWRNQADSGDLALGVNASDQLTFGGSAIGTITAVSDTSTIDLTLSSGSLSAAVIAASLSNSHVAADAAIALSKLAALTSDRALVSSGAGAITVSPTTATELGYVSGVTSALQTQLNARLALAGGTMTGGLTLSGAPSSALHAATKQYVDDAIMGLSVKVAVDAATTTAGTLATSFENGDTVDGVVLATGNRLLVKDQAAPAENGLYIVAASGAPSRATDADTWDELVHAFTFVVGGTQNAGTSWTTTIVAGGTLGTTPVTWAQFGAAASYSADGSGIELSGTTFALELDGSTLSKSASGLKIADLGIANAQVSASAAIARSKVATGTALRLVYNAVTTGALADLAAITASRALVSDADGLPVASAVTATELGYVSGVTSALQTQLNAKLGLSGGTLTGGLTGTTLTLSGDIICDDVTADAGAFTTLTVDGEAVLTSADTGAWVEVISAEVTGAAADTIDITSIPAYDYYDIFLDVSLNNASGTETITLIYNNDSGFLYDDAEGGSPASSTTLVSLSQTATTRYMASYRVNNLQTAYKRLTQLTFQSSTLIADEVPFNIVWFNNTDRISRMTFATGNAAQFQIGSKITVLGMNF